MIHVRHSSRMAALFVMVLALGCRHEPEPTQEQVPIAVHCATAVVADVPDVRTLRGIVAAAPNADAVVAPEVPGRLLRVLVREGDVVRAHQIVAEVDGRPMRDALLAARAQVDQAMATAANDSDVVAREEHLFERGISARQALEAARTAQRRDLASVASARAALDLATHNVERTHVRSPIDGVVLRVARRAGELVDGTPATPVIEVADPAALELVASATPDDLLHLRAGPPAEARFESVPGTVFALHVRTVSPAVDTATGVGAARFVFDPSDVRPPFGLLGEVVVTVGIRRGAIVVPLRALRNPSPEGSELFLCESGVAHVRTVTVQTRVDDRAVVEGLAAGSRVAIDEVDGLEDQSRIRELP